MATAAKAKPSTNGKATGKAKPENVVMIQPVQLRRVSFVIEGTSLLVMHKWSEKAKEMMREKHAGKKTKSREARDTQAEGIAAAYITADGDFGIPAMAFKSALVGAAHKDLGIEKTLVRKALFIICNDPDQVIPIDCEEPVIREDCVRVGAGSTDLRYRPAFANWSCRINLEVDGQLLTKGDLLSLVDRAGFGVGICEGRPEKSTLGWGRFKVSQDHPVEWEEV